MSAAEGKKERAAVHRKTRSRAVSLRPGAAVKRTLGRGRIRPVFAAFSGKRGAGRIAGAEVIAGRALADLKREGLASGQGEGPQARVVVPLGGSAPKPPGYLRPDDVQSSPRKDVGPPAIARGQAYG